MSQQAGGLLPFAAMPASATHQRRSSLDRSRSRSPSPTLASPSAVVVPGRAAWALPFSPGLRRIGMQAIDIAACLANVDELLSNVCAYSPATISESPQRRHSRSPPRGSPPAGDVLKNSSADSPADSDVNLGRDDFFLALPDEVLLRIFARLDGVSLARASCVNRRWYHFVEEYSDRLWQPLCTREGWLALLPLAAADVEPTEARREASACSQTRFWKVVFASHYAIVLQWQLGRIGKLTPSRLVQRRLFVPLTAERWGEILDATCSAE